MGEKIKMNKPNNCNECDYCKNQADRFDIKLVCKHPETEGIEIEDQFKTPKWCNLKNE